jgi:hypothetical protein
MRWQMAVCCLGELPEHLTGATMLSGEMRVAIKK